MRPFKWGTAWGFISSDIRSQIQKFQESALLLSKFIDVKVWPLVSQVPIDKKCNEEPHLKALINGIDTSRGQRDGDLDIITMRFGKPWFFPIFNHLNVHRSMRFFSIVGGTSPKNWNSLSQPMFSVEKKVKLTKDNFSIHQLRE